MKIFEKYGGIIQGIYNNTNNSNLVYIFDTAICAKGILDCYMLTKEKKYLDFGTKLLDWLRTESFSSNGKFFPYYNLLNNKFEEDTSLWYKQSGCLHVKNVIPFCMLYSITNDPKLLDTIKKICDSVFSYQNTDGSISIHEGSKIIHMHTMCYALEGLLYGYFTLNNQTYLKCCKTALDWVVQQINDDGSSNLWFNSKFKQSRTSYHIAQLERLMILVDKITPSNNYQKYINLMHEYLLSLQNSTSKLSTNGGFFEENFKSFLGWKINPNLNSWGSMFALQATYWFEHSEKINVNPHENILF